MLDFLKVLQSTEPCLAKWRIIAFSTFLISRALGVPTSDHSYEDCFLMTEASLRGLPTESAIVEYHKINKELG